METVEHIDIGYAFAFCEFAARNLDGSCQLRLLAPCLDLVPRALEVRDAHHHACAVSVLRDDDGTMRARRPREAVVEGPSG